MNRLPSGLADPLRIGPPFPWWLLLAGALLLAAALLLLWRRSRRPATVAPSPPPPGRMSILSAIRALKNRYHKASSFRQACHELSTLLRAHFEQRHRKPFTTETSREIGQRLGDTALSRFFSLMSETQFRRHEPQKNDFDGLCDLAEGLVESGKGGQQ